MNRKKNSLSDILISGILSCLRSSSSAEEIRHFSADEFEKQLIAVKNEQLIDVCYPREYEKSHIAGARNINFRSSNFREEIDKLNKTKPILIYCHRGVRSKLTAMMCKKMGFKNIYELDEGLKGWVDAGKSVAGTPK
jgi:rhodanese-related sulfurtransferase